MFNMEHVGRNIAELRKQHNMTQLELAEFFGVSVDSLLGERSELVASILEGTLDEYIEKNAVSPKELSNIAPFLDRDMLSQYVKEKYL